MSVDSSNAQERQSTETRLVVRSVQLATEGTFQCEVSGEAPLFQTAKKKNLLTVVGKQQRSQQ